MKQFILLAAPVFMAIFGMQERAVAQNAVPHTEKKVIDREEGFLVCSGGGNNALFAKDCKKASFTRIPGIGYEGSCEDQNGKTSFLACQSLNFEYLSSPEVKKKNTYWQKSKQNKKTP